MLTHSNNDAQLVSSNPATTNPAEVSTSNGNSFITNCSVCGLIIIVPYPFLCMAVIVIAGIPGVVLHRCPLRLSP